MIPEPRRPRFVLAEAIEIGIVGLLVLSPLPLASVHPWSIMSIQITVLILTAFWILMRAKPQANPLLEHSLRTPRLLALAFFAFTALQAVPLPSALVKVISPGVVSLWRGSSAGPLPSFLGLSLIPSVTLMAGSELLAFFLLAFLITKTVTSMDQVRRFMAIIVAMGIFEACYGIIALYSKGRMAAFSIKASSLDSVTGTFVNRNHFAGYLEMVIPLAIALIWSRAETNFRPGVRLRERFLGFVEKDLLANILLVAGIFVMSIALVFSRSRSGIFVLILIFILFLGFSLFLKERPEDQKRFARFLQLLFLGIVVSSILIGVGSTVRRFSLDRTLAEGRPEFWARTLQWTGRFPVFGTGLGTFPSLYPGFEVEGRRLHIYHAHNDYLEYLMESGAVGFLLLAGSIALLLWRSFSTWRDRRYRRARILGMGGTISCLAILVHSITDFNMHIPANMLLFAAVLGLTVVVSFDKKAVPGSGKSGGAS